MCVWNFAWRSTPSMCVWNPDNQYLEYYWNIIGNIGNIGNNLDIKINVQVNLMNLNKKHSHAIYRCLANLISITKV